MSRRFLKFFSLVVVAVLVLSLGACGQKPTDTTQSSTLTVSPAEPVEIEWWCFSEWATGVHGDETIAFISEFESANPGIKIKPVGKPDTEIQSGLIIGAGSGVLPDGFVAAYNVGYELTKTGAVKDVSAEWAALPNDYKAQFQTSAVEGLNIDGKVWGIPITAYTSILYRNLTVLKEAGIDPAAGIKDWADWLKQMDMVKKAGFVAIPNYTVDGWGVLSFLGGVSGVTNSLKDNKTTITVEQLTKCYQMLKDVSLYGSEIGLFDQPASDLFIANKMAFFAMGPWADENFKKAKDAGKLDYDYIPTPGEQAGWTAGIHGGEWLGVTTNKNAAAAFKWNVFYADKKQTTRLAAKVGRLTFNVEAMKDPEVQKNLLIQVCSKALDGGLADAAYFQPFPLSIRQPLADNAGAAVNGTKTPEQAAKDAIDGVNTAISEVN